MEGGYGRSHPEADIKAPAQINYDPAREIAMAIKAASFRALLTEDPIWALLSIANLWSGKSSCRALPMPSPLLPHCLFRFFHPDNQDICIGYLLQFQILKPPLP